MLETLRRKIVRLREAGQAILRLPQQKQILILLNQNIYHLKQSLYHSQSNIDKEALNGQFSKHAIFKDLIAHFAFAAFVETGTYLGGTTCFLAKQNKPVWTVEISKSFLQTARHKFGSNPNIHSFLGNSVAVLQTGILPHLNKDEFVFFYLDAHWRNHLPLREEMELIFACCPLAIVMIDDMKVETDPGYGFDDYGADKVLDLDYLAPVLKKYNAASFSPSLPSERDHLWNSMLQPRGTSVHAIAPEIIAVLKILPSLKYNF